jgi:type I restriction enzyme R subunit
MTIEQTFEALLKLVQDMDAEEQRAVREGLDQESLALFDLLAKPDLDAAGIARIKSVATTLLKTLKAERLRVDNWRDKEAWRDAVRVAIHDFQWSEDTGLPVSDYDEDDVLARVGAIYQRIYWAYPTVPSPYY